MTTDENDVQPYRVEMRPGRPLRILQGERMVVRFLSNGRVKLADDLTDEERQRFLWAVSLYDKLETLEAELQDARRQYDQHDA